MGGRGSSSSTGGAKAIASATKIANRAVDAFLAREGGMTSDGEINGVYEEAFIREAKRLGASNLEINNALNANLRTTDIDYIKGNERLAARNKTIGREVSIYSKDAFQAGNDSRNNLIKAINKYNRNLVGYQTPIKKVSNNGEWLVFADNKRMKTTMGLEMLGLAPKGYMYKPQTIKTTMILPKE